MRADPLIMLITGPMVAGLLCLAVPDRLKGVPKIVAFFASLAVLAGTIFVFLKKPLVAHYGISVILSADDLAAFVASAVALFGFLITVYSMSFIRRKFGRYFGYMLMTLSVSLGVVYSNDLLLVLVFWGFLAAMLYLMASLEGTERSVAAAKKALIIVGGTDAAMLFGIAIIWLLSGSFAMDGVHLKLSGILPYAAFFSLVAACLAKAGAMPFHSWLPDVAEAAPAPVIAYMPA